MELHCVGEEAVTLHGVWGRVCVWNPEGGRVEDFRAKGSCGSQDQSFTLGKVVEITLNLTVCIWIMSLFFMKCTNSLVNFFHYWTLSEQCSHNEYELIMKFLHKKSLGQTYPFFVFIHKNKFLKGQHSYSNIRFYTLYWEQIDEEYCLSTGSTLKNITLKLEWC